MTPERRALQELVDAVEAMMKATAAGPPSTVMKAEVMLDRIAAAGVVLRARVDIARRVLAEPEGEDVLETLTGAEIDTLVALVEAGPLWDGDVPSKTGRDGLVAKGLAMRIIVKAEDGWQAATYAGRDAYKARYPSADSDADTIKEARVNRIAARTIDAARRDPPKAGEGR